MKNPDTLPRSRWDLGLLLHLSYRVIDPVTLVLRKHVESCLLVERERRSALHWHESLPDLETSAETAVVEHKLVAHSWILKPRCVDVEWVPIGNGLVLELQNEETEYKDARCEHEMDVLRWGAVHIGVDIEHKNNVEQRDELRQVLNWHARSDKDEARKFNKVYVAKIQVVNTVRKCVWEYHLGPQHVARSLDKAYQKKRKNEC